MNKYLITCDFTNNILKSNKEIKLVVNDYNSTELQFYFENTDVSNCRKIFRLKKPDGSFFIKEIKENIVKLVGENNKSIITQPGVYLFEVVLYDKDSKITNSACSTDIYARSSYISDIDLNEEISKNSNLPILDQLMEEVIKINEENQSLNDSLNIAENKRQNNEYARQGAEEEREKFINQIKEDKDNGVFDATINGYKNINIESGNNIEVVQEEDKIIVSNTYMYDDTEIKTNISDLNSDISSVDDKVIKNTSQINKNKADIKAINDNLINYSLKTEIGSKIDLSLNNDNYILSAKLKNEDGTILCESSVDFPIEQLVSDFGYDDTTNELIVMLKNGVTRRVPVSGLIRGLVTEINLQTKLEEFVSLATFNAYKKANDTNVKKNSDDINSLNTTLSNLNTELGKVNTKATKVETELNNLKTSVSTLEGNIITEEERTKLSGIEENAQKNKIESISVNGVPINPDQDGNVNIKTDGKIYGIEIDFSGDNPVITRTDDAVGLVANATLDGSEVRNDFDDIPLFHNKICNVDPTTESVVSYLGDLNFSYNPEDGSEVMTECPDRYFKGWKSGEKKIRYQVSDRPFEGSFLVKKWYGGTFPSSLGTDGKVHSRLDGYPYRSQTITTFRNKTRAIGEHFSIMDWRRFSLYVMYLIEYADFNSQKILGKGITYYRINTNDKSLIEENNTNRIVVTSIVANYFKVNQYIRIGKTGAWGTDIAIERKILSKEDYNENGVTGVAINFDGDSVNITQTSTIWSDVQYPTDDILTIGEKSGCINNDGYHSTILRGFCDLYGGEFEQIDGLNIDNGMIYLCTDPKQYDSSKYDEPYTKLSYNVPVTEGTYLYGKAIDIDERFPLIGLTSEVGGSTTTGLCDQFISQTGKRVVSVGGSYNITMSAGLWYFYINNAITTTGYSTGSRFLMYQE